MLTYAQGRPEPELEKSVWRLRVLGLGVENETRISPRGTFYGRFHFTSSSETIPQFDGTNKVLYSFYPALSGGVRHFYNLERRLAKGKSIRYNSGNYISGQVQYNFPAINRNGSFNNDMSNSVSIAALWGFQRTYRRGFYLNLALGVGINRNGGTPASDFTLGYTFPGRGRSYRPL